MIKLPLFKPLEYLSHSSYNVYSACQMALYHAKIGGEFLPRGITTEQMSLGTAFDAFIKYEIALRIGKQAEAKNKLATLLEGVTQEWKSVIPTANAICQEYINAGCLNRLLKDGLEDIELTSSAEIGGKKIEGSETYIGAVRLFGKPDARLRGPIPLDWKVNGYKSSRTTSPKKGYCRRIKDGYDIGNHLEVGIEFQDIDKDWAQQLLFYNWMLENRFGPFHGAIEQILINNERLEFISYRGLIGNDWAIRKQAEVQDAWDRIQEGIFEPATPSDFKCVPFNTPRPCTLVCPEYLKMESGTDLESEIRR